MGEIGEDLGPLNLDHLPHPIVIFIEFNDAVVVIHINADPMRAGGNGVVAPPGTN